MRTWTITLKKTGKEFSEIFGVKNLNDDEYYKMRFSGNFDEFKDVLTKVFNK